MSAHRPVREIWSASTHEGPWWRHRPSITQGFIAAVLAVPVLTLVANAVFPLPTDDVVEWIGQLALAASVFFAAIGISELAYHRLR